MFTSSTAFSLAMQTRTSMKQKFASFALILSFVCGSEEVLITVNGIFNESVTLPTSSPYTSPSEVTWTINKRVTAWYLAPDTVQMDKERFGDRIHLSKGNGSLLIRSAQMDDADIYTVEVTHSEGKHQADVKLIIYEKVDMPILEVLSNISGPRFCNVSVRCASHHGQWVESLCEVTESEIMCWDTDRNDSAHSTVLRITQTKDAINCSSSNPASTSSAPLLPVMHVCNAYAPDPARKHGPTYRSRTWPLVVFVSFFAFLLIFVCIKVYRGNKYAVWGVPKEPSADINDGPLTEPKPDLNDHQSGNPKIDQIDHLPREPKMDTIDFQQNVPNTDPNDFQKNEPQMDPVDLQQEAPNTDSNNLQPREPKVNPSDLRQKESVTDPSDFQMREPQMDLMDLRRGEPNTDSNDHQPRELQADLRDLQRNNYRTDGTCVQEKSPSVFILVDHRVTVCEKIDDHPGL